MGNRAVITMSRAIDVSESSDTGIYLHWNGGRDSVEGFLEYAKLRGIRGGDYGMARLCQIICNFFGGTLSVGVGKCSELDCDNFDNGTYIINDDFEIVGRQFFDGKEQDYYKLEDMLISIDESQPLKEQLGECFLKAQIVESSTLKVGDHVYIMGIDVERPEAYKVVGIGSDRMVNGTNVLGLAYVDKYGSGNASNNINNYIRCATVRIAGRAAKNGYKIRPNTESED